MKATLLPEGVQAEDRTPRDKTDAKARNVQNTNRECTG